MPDVKITLEDGSTVTIDSEAMRTALGLEAPAAVAPPPTPGEIAARKELAIMRSGIDVSGPIGALFLQTYTGELTPEAIAAAAQPLGLAPVVATSTVTEGETGQTQVRSALQHDATVAPGNEPPVHPGISGFQEGMQAFAAGASYEDGVAKYISVVNRAAVVDGDKRSVLDRAAPGQPIADIADRKGYLIPREVAALRPRVSQPA